MRTTVARSLFWTSGKLAKIKTYQRVWRALFEEDNFRTVPGGRRWLPNRLSLKLLRASARVDPIHWDHWALVHENCDPHPCPVCGGCICTWEDE